MEGKQLINNDFDGKVKISFVDDSTDDNRDTMDIVLEMVLNAYRERVFADKALKKHEVQDIRHY